MPIPIIQPNKGQAMLQRTLDKSIHIIQVCMVLLALVAGVLIGLLIHAL